MNNITRIRRDNALALFQQHAGRAMATGSAPKGLEQDFAARLQISPSMWSQIKSSRPIGDKLARQIERLCGHPSGWLDEPQADGVLSSSERDFLELALAAWRVADRPTRRQWREQFKARAAAGDEPP